MRFATFWALILKIMFRALFRRSMSTEVKKVPIPPRGVDYRGKVVLAPMVRSGELPTRLLSLRYGADLVWGPETVDRAMIGTTRRYNPDTKIVEWFRMSSSNSKEPKESVIYRSHLEKEGTKHIFQIGTSDPERAVQAARLVAADVAGIDVNAGCPKPFSTSGGMGAALLRTPDKLCAILEALVKNIVPEFEIGISVKIRLLETAPETEALVRKLCATGITALTIHCRTTPMRPRERALRGQLRMIASVCHEHGVACLVNGDVENRDQGLQLAAEFGADGAMIATTAEKNPSVFQSIADGGKQHWKEVVQQYIKISMDVNNRFGNTKYLLSQMIPGKEKYYQKVNQSKTYLDVCKALEFDDFLDQAKEVDVACGLDQLAAKKAEKRKSDAETTDAGEAKRAKVKDVSQSLAQEFPEREKSIPMEAASNTVALASSG
ncbi:tRNA dihydrouridine synthase (Smm1) [Paramyrothecium foliicola]|nr:tRNA dihydrouridine synthase (Smm1) [Paramyrothecium foliicola]